MDRRGGEEETIVGAEEFVSESERLTGRPGSFPLSEGDGVEGGERVLPSVASEVAFWWFRCCEADLIGQGCIV